MMRLVPESLFNKVRENFKNTQSWTLSMWEELFIILGLSHNTPTVQWNSECRSELMNIIEAEVTQFYSHWKPLSPSLR